MNCDPERNLIFTIVQNDVDPQARRAVERSLANVRAAGARIDWIQAPMQRVRGLKLAGRHTTCMTYVRFLIPELLSADVRKAIYLDCDIVVNDDISTLYDVELAGKSLIAARNYSTLTVSEAEGIRNYRELGIPPHARYFNAGVLVVDVDKWRRSGTTDALFRYLVQHEHEIQMADQEVLNAVLFDDWVELDYRWNWQIPWRAYRNGRLPPPWIPDATRRSLIHFTTGEKPWLPGCDYAEKKHFFDYLDRTEWAGWRVGWAHEVCSRLSRAIGETRNALGRVRRRLRASPMQSAS
jgi:lipopolysaccharide biosynthesis glycosyltransferase